MVYFHVLSRFLLVFVFVVICFSIDCFPSCFALVYLQPRSVFRSCFVLVVIAYFVCLSLFIVLPVFHHNFLSCTYSFAQFSGCVLAFSL